MAGITSIFSDPAKEKWFEKFARFGLASKGIVYCLMGLLSVLASFGLSQKKGDKKEAFKLIYDQPFGQIILIAIALGLFGYVMLRMFQAIKDIDNKGKDMKGIFVRVGYALSAFLYMGIGVYAIKLVLQGKSSGDGNSQQFIVSKVFQYPGGRYLVGIVALVVVGMGIHQIIKGGTGNFMKRINLVRSNMKEVFKKAGVLGYISRGIVLVIIGYLIFHAAWLFNPKEAQGTDAAFEFIENKFGSLLMGIVALGLIGYGTFTLVKAKYQKIDLDI